jgi:hypothetical protein
MIEGQLMDICVFVGGNLVSWRSKKQPIVSKSTAEAEYRAMSLGVSEMIWVRNLLGELKLLRKECLNLWCDNKSAIRIANNPEPNMWRSTDSLSRRNWMLELFQ